MSQNLSHLQTLIESDLLKKRSVISIGGISQLEPVGLMLLSYFSQGALGTYVLVVPDDSLRLAQEVISFFIPPEIPVVTLPSWDVLPTQGIPPSPQSLQERLHALGNLCIVRPSRLVLIASAQGMNQKTIPLSTFKEHARIIKPQESWDDGLLQELLIHLGYQEAFEVIQPGQYQIRGHIIDIFSPAHPLPVRIERFGDEIDKMRYFLAEDQKSLEQSINALYLLPAQEVLIPPHASFNDWQVSLMESWHKVFPDMTTTDWLRLLQGQSQRHPYLPYLASLLHKEPQSAWDYLPDHSHIFVFHPHSIHIEEEKSKLAWGDNSSLCSLFFQSWTEVPKEFFKPWVELESVVISENPDVETQHYPFRELTPWSPQHIPLFSTAWNEWLLGKLNNYLQEGYRIVISSSSQNLRQRAALMLQGLGLSTTQFSSLIDFIQGKHKIGIVEGTHSTSALFPVEKLVLITDKDFLGKRSRKSSTASPAAKEFLSKAQALSFSDLKPGDLVVHISHGIGVYEGLKFIASGGIEAEFVQIRYRDGDKLYVPVFRIDQVQKYVGPPHTTLDKLGSNSWQKAQVKIKSQLRDLASELLQLYAKRSALTRPAYAIDEQALLRFSLEFPFEETPDQERAIEEIKKDLSSTRPMDRLLCGDVGFGKTEVAMRAAFMVASSGKQVAVICPTTVLSFQHFESFGRRFKNWPFRIERLNRFVSAKETKIILEKLKNKEIDIIIGTHRLLSQDVQFADLGLLIIDEEQRFGVSHKEKLKKQKLLVDTLSLSATPIPRTLNLSLTGLRDLSLINTPPPGRREVKTYITKWNENLIKKAIDLELSRGGQVYFIHNRIQTIHELAQDLRRILPPEVRIQVAHGQLPEDQLEQIMVSFFKHEFDVLISTAIVESGVDVVRANTMFIDLPHLMGLSSLYQLRGRVGRAKEQAYCYLLLPKRHDLDDEAMERIKLLQDNTKLGSGLKIAQHDLELRGSGNILGEEQSGHIQSVGYEMYYDLLQQTIAELKGDESKASSGIDCEINLKLPAFIPTDYMSDIRLRLAYYKAISQIRSEEDFEQLESEFKDRFGDLPDPLITLMGFQLLRAQGKKLGVTDISQGPKNVLLKLSSQTPLQPQKIIPHTLQSNKKYQLIPPDRLAIRMNEISWQRVYEELLFLERQFT
jgi:transcription-repair coupling factor (superfamily II helicase)